MFLYHFDCIIAYMAIGECVSHFTTTNFIADVIFLFRILVDQSKSGHDVIGSTFDILSF